MQRGGVAAGGGERQHQMRHHQQVAGVADARLGLVGEFLPAGADVEAEQF